MENKKNKRNYWTKENCIRVSMLCTTKKEFQYKYSGAYKSSIKNNWFEEISLKFTTIKKPNNYWNKENCYIEALKYNNKTDFKKYSSSAYNSSVKNNWFTEITKHMEIKGSLYNRYNYEYLFDDNHVYVGLTCDIKRRNLEHLTSEKSPVFKHIKKTGLTPLLIFDKLKNVNESQNKEIVTIEEYVKKGWVILNKSIGGGLGKTNTKWDKIKAHEEALKYNSRLEFQKKSHTAYKYCLKNKIINDVCSHMIKNNKKNIIIKKWDREKCYLEALKYRTKKEFYTNSQNAYRYSIRNNFLFEICTHMTKK